MSIRCCYARAHLVDLVASHQHVRVLTCQKDRPCRKTKYVNCGHRMNILQAVYKTVSKQTSISALGGRGCNHILYRCARVRPACGFNRHANSPHADWRIIFKTGDEAIGGQRGSSTRMTDHAAGVSTTSHTL